MTSSFSALQSLADSPSSSVKESSHQGTAEQAAADTPTPPKTRKTAVRFRTSDDIILLQQVLSSNPYAAVHGNILQKWEEISNNINLQNGKETTWRTCRDRAMTLLDNYKKEHGLRQRSSATEEEHKELVRLVSMVLTLREDSGRIYRERQPMRDGGVDRPAIGTHTLREDTTETTHSLGDITPSSFISATPSCAPLMPSSAPCPLPPTANAAHAISSTAAKRKHTAENEHSCDLEPDSRWHDRVPCDLVRQELESVRVSLLNAIGSSTAAAAAAATSRQSSDAEYWKKRWEEEHQERLKKEEDWRQERKQLLELIQTLVQKNN
ncbi:uncharacterized protein VTP21DRAFT_1248 [Calcarisporiella thermophila]|uniref:uncharacterized protein n=1 Tax=Calcarisporiella thermophila TaxID=911321 RepID=UPI00374324FD